MLNSSAACGPRSQRSSHLQSESTHLNFSVLRLQSRHVSVAVRAVAKDVAQAVNVATHSNGHLQQHTSVACFTADAPPVLSTTEWTCHAASTHNPNSGHIGGVPLHAQPMPEQQLQHVKQQQGSYSIPLQVVHNSRSVDQADLVQADAQLHLAEQQHMLQQQSLQSASALESAAAADCDDPVGSIAEQHACSAQQQQSSQQAAQHIRPNQQQPQQQKRQQPQLPHGFGSSSSNNNNNNAFNSPWMVQVANSTNPKALAGHLLKHHKQLIQRQRQGRRRNTGSSSSSTVLQPVVLSCSSSAAVHAALHAAQMAASQAAAMPHPQQLLLQPQMVHNALATAADGRCGAAVYQLHLSWVPAAVAAVAEQLPQQQQQQGRKQPINQQQQQQPANSTGAAAHSNSSSVELSTGRDQQEVQGRCVPGPQLVAYCEPRVPNRTASSSRTNKQKRKQTTKCTSQQSEQQAAHSSSSSSSKQQQQQWYDVNKLAQRVHGLLRGNWPCGVMFGTPAGALLAVKALVRARGQLQAAGLDLMLAVDAAQPAAAAAAADQASAAAAITLWAVVCPALPGAAVAQQRQRQHRWQQQRQQQQQAQAVKVPTAELVLSRQRQEQQRAKQLRARLLQQQEGQQIPRLGQQQQQWLDSAPAGAHSSIGPLLDIATESMPQQQHHHHHQSAFAKQRHQQQQQQRRVRQLPSQQQQQQEALSNMIAEAAAAAGKPAPRSSTTVAAGFTVSSSSSSHMAQFGDGSSSHSVRHDSGSGGVQVQQVAQGQPLLQPSG